MHYQIHNNNSETTKAYQYVFSIASSNDSVYDAYVEAVVLLKKKKLNAIC